MTGRITDSEVSQVNGQIAQAANAADAFRIIDGLTRAMLGRLMDLNHVDPDVYGLGEAGRAALGVAHNWNRSGVRVGDVRMSYVIDPCGLDGRPINGGNHYSNADTADAARERAVAMLTGDPTYLGYTLGSVSVYGKEMRFRGDGWVAVPRGRTDSFVITRQDAGAPPVFLTDETHCWDTTVMDVFETVHAMRTDGTCQCGDPTRNAR